MTPQQAARYQTPTPGNVRAAYGGGPASLAGWLIARLVMTIGTHQSDHTLSEKAEASFEESDPQRLKTEAEQDGRAMTVSGQSMIVSRDFRHFGNTGPRT